MRRLAPLLVKSFLLAVLAAPLAAQDRADPAPAADPGAPALAAAPSTLAALAQLRGEASDRALLSGERPAFAAAPLGRGGRREAIALMVVGGAGVVTGLIADEDILVIAGAVVGGVGLFFYLR